MVCGSHATTRAIYSTPPCPSLAASTAAYRRRSFSDSHPKNRCIFCSTSAAYPSMPRSLIQNGLCGKDTTASAIREVILDHILRSESEQVHNARRVTLKQRNAVNSPESELSLVFFPKKRRREPRARKSRFPRFSEF